MVSVDHFRLELLTQMAEAATKGQLDILINSQVANPMNTSPAREVRKLPGGFSGSLCE